MLPIVYKQNPKTLGRITPNEALAAIKALCAFSQTFALTMVDPFPSIRKTDASSSER